MHSAAGFGICGAGEPGGLQIEYVLRTSSQNPCVRPTWCMNDPDQTGAYEPGLADAANFAESAPALPQQIGRYRVEALLGQGGFGLVYRAHDDQLQRLVAIKVPHARLVADATDAEAYLTEARTVANLDHPNIVPVYDVGSSERFPCFIVSK